MKGKFWYIKERNNPQLGVKFYALGNISKQKANDAWYSLYGYNIIHKFDTENAYLEKCKELGIDHV